MSGTIIRTWAGRLAFAFFIVAGLTAGTQSASAAKKVTITGNAYSFIFAGHTERLPGAKIAIDELPGVSTTAGANGAYSLKVPDNTTITPYATMPGYHKIYLQTFHTSGSDLQQVNFQMPPDEIYSALGTVLGTQLDPETGDPVKCAIVSTFFKESARHYENFDDFWADTPHGIEGSTAGGFTRSGKSLPPTLYFNSQVIPDPNQPVSSNDGGAIWDEVDTGVYTVKGQNPNTRFSRFQATCKPGRLINANPPWGLYQLAPGEKPNPAVFPDRVRARLTRAKAERYGSGRVVNFELVVDEPVKVKLTVKQGRITQVTSYKRYWKVGGGVAQWLKRSFKPGRATFRVHLTDKAGNRKAIKRILHIPKARPAEAWFPQG